MSSSELEASHMLASVNAQIPQMFAIVDIFLILFSQNTHNSPCDTPNRPDFMLAVQVLHISPTTIIAPLLESNGSSWKIRIIKLCTEEKQDQTNLRWSEHRSLVLFLENAVIFPIKEHDWDQISDQNRDNSRFGVIDPVKSVYFTGSIFYGELHHFSLNIFFFYRSHMLCS